MWTLDVTTEVGMIRCPLFAFNPTVFFVAPFTLPSQLFAIVYSRSYVGPFNSPSE
jgi:hypothetical protein